MTKRADGMATAVPNRLPRWASGVAYAACGWAFVFAALSCYWALGGTVGTETVSPAIVQLARAHDPWVEAALWLSAFIKVISGIVVVNRLKVRTQILGRGYPVRTFSPKTMGRMFGLISDRDFLVPLGRVFSCLAFLLSCLLALAPLVLLEMPVSCSRLPSWGHNIFSYTFPR